MGNLTFSSSLGLDAFEVSPLELRPLATESDLQDIIRAVYRQVLGNAHIMDNQRLDSAESLLRDGSISVKGFVRTVAQSGLYQSLFFEPNSAYRFIELNFKHLLGRAPQDQSEIAEHVALYNAQGYEAEIDSYLDRDEYNLSFGESIVPYPRGICSQPGFKNEAFNRMFSLLRGSPTSDVGSKSARLISSLAANLATPIKFPAKSGALSYSNTGKRFKIVFTASQASAQQQGFSQQFCTVNYDRMSKTVQNIHRSGGRIVSVTEVG